MIAPRSSTVSSRRARAEPEGVCVMGQDGAYPQHEQQPQGDVPDGQGAFTVFLTSTIWCSSRSL